MQSCEGGVGIRRKKKTKTVHYLKEIRDDHMDRVRLGPPIIDEKEVDHWRNGLDWVHEKRIEHADALFLISSNGVPRHCTTSVNRGDTASIFL